MKIKIISPILLALLMSIPTNTTDASEAQNSQETATNTHETYIANLEKAATILQLDTLGAIALSCFGFESTIKTVYPVTTICNAALHTALAKEHIKDKKRFGYHRNQAFLTTARTIALLRNGIYLEKNGFKKPNKNEEIVKLSKLALGVMLISVLKDIFDYLRNTKNFLVGRTDLMDMDLDYTVTETKTS